MPEIKPSPIKAIIGLGNPGPRFYGTRHNIGFAIVDVLAQKYNGHWQKKDSMEIASIIINDQLILLIKPLTFMNDSGLVIPHLRKKGIELENIIVIHDDLEQPFGSVKSKFGGSAKGHNGLKSIIAASGSDQFMRLRFGIGRPAHQEEVPAYVLERFNEEPSQVDQLIDQAVAQIESIFYS